jgi:hypothetical protein
VAKNEAPIVTIPQQVDEPNSTPFDVQKTLNTTPLTRDAISKFMLDTIRVRVSKKRPTRSLFHAQDKVRSGLVDDFLDGILGLADGLLSFTAALLQGAPSTSRFGLPTALPAPSLTTPAASFAMPLILSVVLLMIGLLKN